MSVECISLIQLTLLELRPCEPHSKSWVRLYIAPPFTNHRTPPLLVSHRTPACLGAPDGRLAVALPEMYAHT
jgi:hypothetical protein